jgi:ribosomal protein L37E
MPFEKNKPQEYCSECGKSLIEGKKICSYCGYEKKTAKGIETRETNKLLQTCLTCNKPVVPNKKYCAVCEIKRIVNIRSKSEDLPSGKYCQNCGKEISSWENTCNYCSKKNMGQEDNQIQDSPAQLCDKCGNPIGAGKSVCSFCGYGKTKKLKDGETGEKKFSSAQYCSKCGEQLEQGTEICIFCGNDMRKPLDEMPEGDFEKDIKFGLVMPVIEETFSDKDYCKSCGEVISEGNICLFCGYGETKKIGDTEEEREDKSIAEKLRQTKSDKVPSLIEKVLSTPSSDIPSMVEKVFSSSVIDDEVKEIIPHEEVVTDEPAVEEVKYEPVREEVKDEPVREEVKSKIPSDKGSLSVSLKVSHLIYLSLAIVTVFILIIFGIIYAMKFSHKSNVSTVKTPSALPVTPVITVMAMNSPVIKSTPSPEPVKESTDKPVAEIKPTVYSVMPTQPTYIETPVIPAVVPTRIPTRPVRYKTPKVTTGYVPYTPAPTQVDYKTANRNYCDNAINNKIVPLYNERRYSEAITECNYLLSLDQNYYMNYVWMASCYLASKDPVDAKYYIDMAWKLEWNEKRTPYEQSESKKLYDWYLREGGK